METLTSTNQLVTFQLEDDHFGIDIMVTQEILKLNQLRKIPNSPFYFEGMLDLRGEVLPVVNFKKLFKFGTFDLSKEKGIIILRIGNQHFGVVIDKILRVITLEKKEVKKVPESFSKALKQYIIGVIEHQDELISILDVQSIFQTVDKDIVLSGENEFLDFRRDKFELLNLEEEKEINRFIESIDYKQNLVTSVGIRNYFSRSKLKNRTSIKELTQNLKKVISSSGYSVFQQDKTQLFFDHFDDFYDFLAILEHVIIPMKIKKNDKKLKIVHLDCGKGMVTYSILFILKAFLPNFDSWKVEIFAFGDKFDEINQANKGTYTAENLIQMNKNELSLFFEKKEKHYQVYDELKEKVVFHFGSTKNFEKVKDVDLFFCRGIFSKMENQAIPRLIVAIKESLSFAGILLLSEIEDLLLISQPLSPREINGRKYYLNI